VTRNSVINVYDGDGNRVAETAAGVTTKSLKFHVRLSWTYYFKK
jgi:hypothetical protein